MRERTHRPVEKERRNTKMATNKATFGKKLLRAKKIEHGKPLGKVDVIQRYHAH
jgi:hypothetical protein